MKTDGIVSKITHYLNTPGPSYALLLFGEWGVGKSFYWRNYRNTSFPAGKHDITFSVAGLMTLEELERALFLASVKDVGPRLLKETGTVVGRAIFRWVNIDPNDIKLKADVRPEKTVICIDDLERFGGNFQVLFGFIVSLLDDAGLHVILIADETKAMKELKGYARYKERIIGRSLAVPPAVAAFYKDVVSGFAHMRTREALLAQQDTFVHLFEEKKLKNLRTVRAILDELNAVLSSITWPEATAPSLEAFFSAMTFVHMAHSKDAGNRDLVRQAFLQPDLSMELAIFRMEQEDKPQDDKQRPLAQLIVEAGFENEAHGWALSHDFAAYVAGDPFEAKGIAADFRFFGREDKEASLLERFRDYRLMPEEQFRETLGELRSLIDQRQIKSVQEIWVAFQLLYHMSELRLSGLSAEGCVALFLKVIADYETSLDIQAGLDVWPGPVEESAMPVIAALERLDGLVIERQLADDEGSLRDYLFTGTGDEVREISLTPLAGQNVVVLYDRLKTGGRAAARRIGKLYSRRLKISNIAQFGWREATEALALADLIESEFEGAQTLTLDQAALHELSTVLRQYSRAVEGGRPSRDKKGEEAEPELVERGVD